MNSHRRRLVVAAIALVTSAGAGTLLVTASAHQPSPDAAGEVLAVHAQVETPAEGVTDGATLARGTSPSGASYEISRIRFAGQPYCIQVSVGQQTGQGCLEAPARKGELKPGEFMFGDDLFVVALADHATEGMRARRLDAEGFGQSKGHADLGATRLLHLVIRAAQPTLPRTEAGLPVPPSLEITAIDAGGLPGSETELSAPLSE